MGLIGDVFLSMLYVAMAFSLFFVGKLLYSYLHKDFNLKYELFEADNPAMALAVVGYYGGLTMAIGGVLVGESLGFWMDLWNIIVYGLLAVILLNLSWYICDLFILRGFKASDEIIRDRNQGAGALAGAAMVASGFILFGSIQGEGGGVFTAIIFWALGQFLLVMSSWLYEWITPYSVRDEMEKDNVAVGVAAAGAMVAMGMVVGLAAEDDFVSWGVSLPYYITWAVIGLLMLPAIRWFSDLVLVPGATLTDELANQEEPNLGAAYIEAFSYIAAATFISWCA